MNRTLAAILLTLAAVAIPSSAWFVAGRDAAEREAARIEGAMRFEAFKVAHGLAQRLGGHLEALRESESRRPPFHYQADFHDPNSNCECASVTPSPLSLGPTDPVILAHFQVDTGGRLSMPSLNRVAARRRGANWYSRQLALFREIQSLVPALRAMLREPGAAPAARPTRGWTDRRPKRAKRSAWVDAAELGAGLGGAASRLFSRPERSDYANEDSPDFQRYKVGFFKWHVQEMHGDPTLLALRRVEGPEGRLLQCFAISNEFVNQSMRHSSLYDARFLPGGATDHPDSTRFVEAGVALAGSEWRVQVDPGEAMREAAERGSEVRASFRRTFAKVAAASLLAGLCIVGLIWQTDRLSRQRQRFAASAAHELRTPLAGLRVYGDMLAEGLGDPSATHEYARQVSAEAERLGRVVSNVLGYSQLERGALSVQPVVGDLAGAVRDCIGRFEAAVEAAGARIRLSLPSGLPSVKFDRDAVFHIVQNLVDNAEKHTRGAADRTIDVGMEQRGDHLVLSVADRGPGVPPSLRGKLFEPFARGANGPDQPAGLGLGLTLVKKLAEEHGGTIRYVDVPEGGAKFSVSFPVSLTH